MIHVIVKKIEKNEKTITKEKTSITEKDRKKLAKTMLEEVFTENGIKDWTIEVGEKGKPYLKNHPEFQYNISHSGDYVVLAWELNKNPYQIGVDIQEPRKISDAMARRILSADAYDNLPNGESERNAYLLCIWTILESYSKMLGIGLSLDFKNCVIDFDNCTVQDAEGKFPIGYFKSDLLCEDYYLTLCTNSREA